jgi:hypothetical protein
MMVHNAVYIMNHYNSLGILVKEGIVDSDQVFMIYSPGIFSRIYRKFRPWLDTQGYRRFDGKGTPYYSGIRHLHAEALRLYPDVGYLELPKSIDDLMQNVRRQEELRKSL